MSYQDPIYNQNGNGERNQTIPVVNTSSDICVFSMPVFTMSGASKIDCTGTTLTSGSTNVYPLTGETSIDVGFTFTANTSSLTGNTIFRFEVYKYNNTIGIFEEPYVFQSTGYTWDSYSGTSAFTATIPVVNLNVDGDYLVKGYYVHDICTEFAGLLGNSFSTASVKTGDEYGLYQSDRDSYFVAFTAADTPELTITETSPNPLGSLITHSFILDGTEETLTIPSTTVGSSYMIALNGLTLAEDYDYSITANSLTSTVTLTGGTVSGDIVTYVYLSSTSDDTLRHDTIDITEAITSGTTDNEGTNDVYYNTTEGKYEIYTSLTPVSPNDIVVTLNGATLANNIDYYQSITNPKRIILEGGLVVGDLINIYYITNVSLQGNVTTTSFNFGWLIENEPQTTNGLFTVEISDSDSFTTISQSGTSEYVVGLVNYNLELPLVGEVGDVLYYRIKNEKNYTDLCGTDILTTAYSEIIDITIQTNASNSY
jgi:hypothetical protein